MRLASLIRSSDWAVWSETSRCGCSHGQVRCLFFTTLGRIETKQVGRGRIVGMFPATSKGKHPILNQKILYGPLVTTGEFCFYFSNHQGGARFKLPRPPWPKEEKYNDSIYYELLYLVGGKLQKQGSICVNVLSLHK